VRKKLYISCITGINWQFNWKHISKLTIELPEKTKQIPIITCQSSIVCSYMYVNVLLCFYHKNQIWKHQWSHFIVIQLTMHINSYRCKTNNWCVINDRHSYLHLCNRMSHIYLYICVDWLIRFHEEKYL
jgi:hypothetical protein